MSAGEFARNSRNVVCTKDRWQFLIAKDFRFWDLVAAFYFWQTLCFSHVLSFYLNLYTSFYISLGLLKIIGNNTVIWRFILFKFYKKF